MALKTFGTLTLNNDKWLMTDVKPHVCIKLKSVFPKIPKTGIEPFAFRNTPAECADLLWFMSRYPMKVSGRDFDALYDGKKSFERNVEIMEEIMMPSYVPSTPLLRNGFQARDYQCRAAELHARTKRMLLGDDVGLGKTLSAILTFKEETLPSMVVVQTHLTKQWRDEIEKFTDLRTHIIKGTSPYNLPAADVYLIKYSCLSGWINVFQNGFFKSVVFDEAQELRRSGSQRYNAAKVLAGYAKYCIGMSATPIYNYGDEIFNIMDLINPGCLGTAEDFLREWANARFAMKPIIKDPKALGTYLRDNYLFLRRTRQEVGRELPPINKIVHVVGYDDSEVKRIDSLAKQLAIKIVSGSFMERGMAARELDLLVRQKTGVAKAREVAEYVKILLDGGEPVLLAGWHREVYDIWKEHLAEYNPVFYTGTESETQKQKAKDAFINGDTNLFIISLRSGVGLDGLQHRCKTVVIGELDWSPQVHNQLIGRVDRDGRDIPEQVTAIYLVCEYGSDPVIIDLLGLKSSQSHGIINPLTAPVQTVNDESRIKRLADQFLKKHQYNDKR